MKHADLHNLAAGAAVLPGLIERCTLYPWIADVTVTSRNGGSSARIIEVAMLPSGTRPEPEDYCMEGESVLRADVFPAERFHDMPAETRQRYKQHRRVYLLSCKARDLKLDVRNLRPWVDYDPIYIHEETERWASPGVRFSGD